MLHVLNLAVILFALGLIGLLTRRNLIFTLMSVEVMLNAAGLAFVAGSYQWGKPDGQVMFLFILAMAAAEVSVGLALLLQFHRREPTLDSDTASEMKG
ncbi:MAG TPA: NADH-quinone oxidoreductase subunit NuoK [Bryobacteraceae bacterium]|jgi:NADH-quinone oxidoreductase subunit K